MPKILRFAFWIAVSLLGALSLATIALHRGEQINALWLVAAAVCTYAVAYRFYSSFVAAKVLALDPLRATPAERLDNGRDFVPTNKWVVFGHHFAAIAGPGPLVGPVLAAQFGYLQAWDGTDCLKHVRIVPFVVEDTHVWITLRAFGCCRAYQVVNGLLRHGWMGSQSN